MEPLTLGFSAALVMGLVFGAGPCNVTCLPYLGPVFLGKDGSWRVVLPFSAGRLLGYGGLGAAAGFVGHALSAWVEGPWAAWGLGGATALAGLVLLRRSRRPCAPRAVPTQQPLHRARPLLPLGLFGMGLGMAFNPCAPLGTVLLAAAATASAAEGASLGLGFGLGAVLVPALLFGWVVAHFGHQVRAHLARWGSGLERAAGGLLVTVGALTAMGWMGP